MLVTWRFHPRGSLLEKLDPRTRWISSFLILFSITCFWDIRFLLFFFVMVMAQFVISKVSWQESKRAWIFIFFFIVVIVGLNALLSGRAGPSEVIYRNAYLLQTCMEPPVLRLENHPGYDPGKSLVHHYPDGAYVLDGGFILYYSFYCRSAYVWDRL